jgi:hypothetical protein
MHFCDPPPEPTPQGNGIPLCRVATRFFALLFGSLFFTVLGLTHTGVFTLTHFAEHSRRFSHDLANRDLARERVTPRLVWENVRG